MKPTALILHGGGGPFTVANLATHLATTFDVIAPTHPGWSGTDPVPGDTIASLAARYRQDLADRDATDVLVVGSSLGGWIAAEMAVQDAGQRIGRVILIDAVGAEVPGAPIRDFFTLDARGVAEYAWADPERGYIDPTTRTPEQLATMGGNMAALRAYSGTTMSDPTLLARVGTVAIPSLVVWGDSDRIVTPAYGEAIAAAMPTASFVVIDGAGHLPHLEQPRATFSAIDEFLAE